MGEGIMTCFQIVLTIMNVVQFLFGWLFIIAGAVIHVKGSPIEGHDASLQVTAIYLIVIGCILVVISLVGCIGAWKKNFCLLVTFCVLVSIIFILVLIALIVAFVLRSKAEESSEFFLNEQIKNNDTKIFEALQTLLQCCGVTGPDDWKKNFNYSDGSLLPKSCCLSTTICRRTSPDVRENGCKDPFTNLIRYPLLILGSIAVWCAVMLFLCVYLAGYLAHSIRGEYHAV